MSLEQLKRENPADATDIEQALAAGNDFRVRGSKGSMTVYAH
jgi:expansin (peptidoglycan-binding protein)